MELQRLKDILVSAPEFQFECEVKLQEGKTTIVRSNSIQEFWSEIDKSWNQSMYRDFVGIQKQNCTHIITPGSSLVEPGSYTLVSRTNYLNDIELDKCIRIGVQKLNGFRALQPNDDNIQRVDEELLLRHCHFSLCHEGNKITLDELQTLWKRVAQGNLKDEYSDEFEAVSNNDLTEAVNHITICQNIQYIAKHDIDEELVLKLHSKLMKGLLHEERDGLPGEYRKKVMFGVPGNLSVLPEDPDCIRDSMESFFNGTLIRRHGETKLNYLARVHTKFQWVWPFLDGNGRISDIIMTILLVRADYPVFALPPTLSRLFDHAVNHGFKCLKDSVGEKLLSRLLAEAVFSSLAVYERAIGEQLLPSVLDIVGGRTMI